MTRQPVRRVGLLLLAASGIVACGDSESPSSTETDAAEEASVDAAPSCQPAPLDEWTPPAYHKAQPAQATACTSALLADFYASCYGPASAEVTCNQNWGTNADLVHETCQECLVTQSTSVTWGPIVNFQGVGAVNIAGCIELLDPKQATCATAVQQAEACEQQLCATTCVGLGPFDSCVTLADRGACGPYASEAVLCEYSEADGGAASACVNGMTFEDTFLAVAGAFCGG